MWYQSSYISFDTKEWLRHCNLLLDQVDQKKGCPSNLSIFMSMLIKFNNLHQYFWTSELYIRFASCMLYSWWIFLIKTVIMHIWLFVHICQQFRLYLLLPTIALHKTLLEFFMSEYVQVIILNNISLSNLVCWGNIFSTARIPSDKQEQPNAPAFNSSVYS